LPGGPRPAPGRLIDWVVASGGAVHDAIRVQGGGKGAELFAAAGSVGRGGERL